MTSFLIASATGRTVIRISRGFLVVISPNLRLTHRMSKKDIIDFLGVIGGTENSETTIGGVRIAYHKKKRQLSIGGACITLSYHDRVVLTKVLARML